MLQILFDFLTDPLLGVGQWKWQGRQKLQQHLIIAFELRGLVLSDGLPKSQQTELMGQHFFISQALLGRVFATGQQIERCIGRWLVKELYGVFQGWCCVVLFKKFSQ